MPGRDDALPQLRRDAPDVEVESGEEVVLDLEDYVIAASGRPVRITDAATVRASHSDGTDLVVDDDTLRFRSAPGYFGPASLSFTVTDGESAADPSGRTGTIVIPITVQPTDDQPPVFTGGVIDFEPGQSKAIDLVKLTDYPYPDAIDELAFRVLAARARGLRRRTRRPGAHDRGGGVHVDRHQPGGHDRGRGCRGRRSSPDASSCAWCRRRARSRSPQPTSPSLRAAARPRSTCSRTTGRRTRSPSTPLRVVAVRGLDDSLPAGVTVEPSADRSTLAVDVAPGAAPINTTLQYQVADATDDPSRYAWGTVTISVQDRPDPVTGAQVTGFGDGTLDVAFGAGGFNNSPITGYEIALVDPSGGEVLEHLDVRGDHLHGADARQRAGERGARPGAGAQRDRRSPTPSRRPGRSGPT